jgi:hypothetical protein
MEENLPVIGFCDICDKPNTELYKKCFSNNDQQICIFCINKQLEKELESE